jgi:type III restriction enzyme
VEYIITVEALKEGWDCPFAYVFCSVANVKSARAVEQLLGRVLRMPYAKKRSAPALNRAYAALVSQTFMQAANDLRDTLIDKMGYEASEAEGSIEAANPLLHPSLFDRQSRSIAASPVPVSLTPETSAAVAATVPGKLVADAQTGGLSIVQFLTPREIDRARSAFTKQDRPVFERAIETFIQSNRHIMAPAESGASFVVPALMTLVQGELDLADTDIIMENTDWTLSSHPARLTEAEFAIRKESQSWEVDIAGGRVFVQSVESGQRGLLEVAVEGWTEQGLVQWLDRQVRDANIGQGDLVAWLSEAIGYLTRQRGISIAALHQCRHVLMRELRKKIAAIKAEVRETAYQAALFAPAARPGLSIDRGFRFEAGMFDGTPLHKGHKYRFDKHFLGWDKVPRFDSGAEEQCAVALDSLPQVKHWVRNVAKHDRAFHLPVSSGRYYPDFVAELMDGRLLVVEYKGGLFVAADQHKRNIGELWGNLDRSRALFLWVESNVGGRDPRGQLEDFLATNPAGGA